jgi:hypothetical protein
MSRAVSTVAATPRRRRLRFAAAVCAPVVVVLLLLIVGPSRKQAATAPAADRRAAANAAVTFAQELAVTGVSKTAVYGPRLRRIAAPGAEARVRAAFGKGAEEVRHLIGETGVLRAAPMGYRIDSFSARAASVSVWMVALAGGPRLAPTAQWRVLTLDLTWSSTGWRVIDGSGGGGPSPRTPLSLLATETATFKELRHVP